MSITNDSKIQFLIPNSTFLINKSGFININKPPDMTSHDVVNRVRKIFNTKKVGHTGTLDPFATGVLPIAVGRAAKFIEYLNDCDKSYRAEILFGTETATGDITGEVIGECKLKAPLAVDKINEILKTFIGNIQQTPPKYSAIKINGRKAYELARKKVDFSIPSREVTIYNIEIVELTENTLTIVVDCSKGTYIRSLAVDIGKSLGIPATLKTLQRTRAGNFEIDNAVVLEELKPDNIISVDTCLEHLPRLELPPHRLKAFSTGLSTRLSKILSEGSLYRVYLKGEFIGTGKIVDGELKSDKIFQTVVYKN